MVDRIVTVPDSLELPASVKVPSARLSDSTATGRAVLAAADSAAARAAIGVSELATTAEAIAGTDTTRAVTPAGLKAVADTKAPALGSDDNYVTDAEKVKIANLSGTNTGDQDLSGYLTTSAAPELIRDTMGAALVAGTNVTITPDDAGDSITIAAAGAVTLTTPQSITGAKTMTGLSVQPAVPAPTFSANLAPDLGGWTLAGGATIAAGTVTIPSGGSLSTTIAATSGKTYQIDVSRSASSGGPMIVSLGAVTIQPESWANSSVTLVASSSGALTLTIGGGTWVATVTGVIVREVTAQASPVLSGGIELRRLNDNVAAGTASQRSLTTGNNNVAAGNASQYSLTTGTNNVAAGNASQYSLTTGNRNVAAGADSQYRPRNVGAWTTTTASGQTSIGHQSGQGSATPSDEITTVGYWAIADGLKATALGARSSAAHAGSVALGSDVTTTSTGQVAVGPRDVEVQDATKGVVLRAPDGGRWRATIGNAGVVTWTKL